MILTTDFLKRIEPLFETSGVKEVKEFKTSDSSLNASLVKSDANTIIITITRKDNPNKQKLEKFISNMSDNQFQFLTDSFEDITGKPLTAINDLYEKGKYEEVYNLLKLTLNSIVEDFNKLLK